MRYVGGKCRFASDIVQYFAPYGNRPYVEPFVGGAAVLEQVTNRIRFANDAQPYLIALLTAVQAGWTPPTVVDEEDYYAIKADPTACPELTGFVGFACSFGTKWWGGYARGNGRNFADEISRGLDKERAQLQGVTFSCGSYLDMHIPEEPCLIYCDPPYTSTQGYSTGTFDHQLFWQWTEALSDIGHKVFVSEYACPLDVPCVWSRTRAASLDLNTGGKQSIEKLFELP